MAIFVEQLKGWVAPADAVTSFYGDLENSFWLDREQHATEPFSVIGTGIPATDAQVAEFLHATEVGELIAAEGLPFRFRPGLVGVFNYETGRDLAFGGAAVGDAPKSMGNFLWVDRAMVFDHVRRHIYFIADVATSTDFNDWYHAALLRLALIGGNSKLWLYSNPSAQALSMELFQNKTEYLASIAVAKDEISKGNSYQLCLTNRIRGQFEGSPLSYFLQLRKRHAAPYAGFFRIGQLALATISPERLLTVANGRVWSSPIKGTRARSASGADDAVARELAADPKERAENLMIVDLLRNDLQQVCATASVSVSELLSVKTYSTLHQLVSEVSGVLLPGVRIADILGACFPAGSMTGAPKLSAMRILESLERTQRGLYSGGFGYLANSGDFDLGMVIRAVTFNRDRFEIGVGGGLTADSSPEFEYSEMLLKAKALIEPWNLQPDW